MYNGADINDARSVWAHDMGPAKNEELIHCFKYRHVLLVDADDHPPKLVPYTGLGVSSARPKREVKSAAQQQTVRDN